MASVWLENRTKSPNRENNWYLLWRYGGRGSKKFHRRLGNVPSHVAAGEKRKKATELARGETGDHVSRVHKLSLKEFINQFWLPDRDVETTTAALTKLRLEKYILPALGHKPIAAITRQDVRAFLRTIYDPQTKTGKMTTARQCAEVLKALYNWGVEEELLSRNPLGRKLGRNLRKRYRPTEPLSIDDVCRLIAHAPSYWQAFILTAALTGLRWGELIALTAKDINFETELIHVNKQRATNDREVRHPKQWSIGSVDILPPVKDALMDVFLREADRLRDPTRPVFVNRHGGYPHPRNFMRRVWDPIFPRAGIRRFKFHHEGGLRHFFGSLLLQLTHGNLKYVQDQLRHADLRTTANTYAQQLRETQKGHPLDAEVVWKKFRDAYQTRSTAPYQTPDRVARETVPSTAPIP
jgi:integrase